MRRIKFRVWDKITKQLVYLDKVAFVNYEIDSKNNGFELSFSGIGKKSKKKQWLRKPEDYVLQQFTGLKDKNGVEIYEGDILQIEFDSKEYETQNGVVTFDFGAFGFECKDYRGLKEFCWVGSIEEKEIIGNVFENKELVK